jgi:hypothetical protein
MDQDREETSSLAHKLRRIKRHVESDAKEDRLSRVTFTQTEINSYLKRLPELSASSGVSDIHLRLESGRVHLSARVDLDRMHAALSKSSASSPPALLSGQMPIEISGRFDSADGFGAVVLDEVRLGPTLVSPEVVARFTRSLTRSSRNPDGVDILSPFRLPYSIRRIRLKAGKAVLDF